MQNQDQFQSPRVYHYYDIIMALFVTILIVSNIASAAKIVDWGVSIVGIPLAFDAGTILFPISYIFGDLLTEVYGFNKSRRVIWVGFFCLALTSFIFFLVRNMPGESNWLNYAGQPAYDSILGGISTGGIVLASLVAYLFGEFTNSVILAKMKVATNGRWLWMRTIGSTLVGEGVDTLVFVTVASLAGVFPWVIFPSLMITNYLFKCGVEILMTPVTYWVVGFLKKAENEDYYDRQTKFRLAG
jgi:queuosine precursor transporter